MKVLTDTGLAYYHSKLQDEFVSQDSLSSTISTYLDDYLDNVDWTDVLGNTYVTQEDVEDMISSADLDAYLPKTGGLMTGEILFTPNASTDGVSDDTGTMLACRIGTKGTPPAKDQYYTIAISREDSNLNSNDNHCRYGLVESKIASSGNTEMTLTAYKNEANSTSGATLTVGYDLQNNKGYAKALGNTIATFDSNNKLVFPNGDTLWFA